ncbi:MAG: sodium:alanine symporter family protein [Oscillospiraceae bacterium]|nr:sodium:alanine symporter family protein [Oscillospiraceae bacterium]
MFQEIYGAIASVVWGAPMLAMFLFTGGMLTLRAHGFQLRRFGFWTRETFGSLRRSGTRKSGDAQSISQWQALTSALAACLGTGNIVGVATAITLGGPGAVFWMCISALLGMMTCCAENILGLQYRWRTESGGWMGGPMAYLRKGLGSKTLAGIYAALLSLASFGIGNMTQANAISESLRESFRLPRGGVAAAVCVLLGLVVFGGVARIAKVTEKIVPLMTGLFLLASMIVLVVRAQYIPNVLRTICREAFRVKPLAGGVAGFGLMKSMRYGIARGVFSNEAGLGSSAVVHAAADTKEPVRQGMWGIAEVFIDTIVMCTMTALVLLCSDVWTPETAQNGVALVSGAFAVVFGVWGHRFVTLSIVLFAFATLTGWSFYGEQGARYLLGEKSVQIYRSIYLLAAALGALMKIETVWSVSDILNGLMAIPNLIGVLLLSGQAVRQLRRYETRGKMGLRV